MKLSTRSGLDWTAKFAPIAKALQKLKLPSALIDGEIVVENASGISSFAALQQALADGDTGAALFYAFDLLYIDGKDIRALPLTDRKALLLQSLDDAGSADRIRFSEHLIDDGAAMARHACRLGLEGIVAKRADAAYRSGRSDLWRKVKCTGSQEFVVAGFMPSGTAPIRRLVDPGNTPGWHPRPRGTGGYGVRRRGRAGALGEAGVPADPSAAVRRRTAAPGAPQCTMGGASSRLRGDVPRMDRRRSTAACVVQDHPDRRGARRGRPEGGAGALTGAEAENRGVDRDAHASRSRALARRRPDEGGLAGTMPRSPTASCRT